ncbi:MAG TPA: IS66 family transposase [Verrucomicrobiae bacterium]|nr:IS66 family transposase [Verrucomicrobiae bacterium]
MTPREQELARQLEECQGALAQSRRENDLLRQKIDLLIRRVFGSSSERLDKTQLELLLQLPESLTREEPAASWTAPITSRCPHKERAPRLPENLPVIVEVIDPEPVKQKPEAWRCIGQEVSEQLDFEPGRFLRRRTIRRKYVHRVDLNRVPLIAPLPERLLDRSLPAPGLLAQVLVGKYCDHLPLYRQEQIYGQRHRVHLPRQTLARWVELAADWLKPIYEHIRTGVMAGGYVQVDETPIDYLEPGNGKTKQGYLWTVHRPGRDGFYHWQTSRAAACLDEVVPVHFTGILQSDGYSAVRHEVDSAIVQYGSTIKRTCGSVCSSLSAPARLTTVRSEAAKTTPFCLRANRPPRGSLRNCQHQAVGRSGWMTCPTYVNRPHASLNRISQ